MPEIVLAGQTVPYTVRRSKRARAVSLRIDAERGLQVVVPWDAPAVDVTRLLHGRAEWILRHQERLQPGPQRQYVTGEILPLLDATLRLEVAALANRTRMTVALRGEALVVRLGGSVPEAERGVLVRGARTAELAAQHGFSYGRVMIRDQRTRWGSCSSKQNLNFNWRLMLAPAAAVDYVILHELFHLREMNHSRRFWAQVAACCPDYRRWVDWFKACGAELVL